MLCLILVLTSLFSQESSRARDPWLGKGELTIYWSETESGTIARRDLRDEAGWIIRTIYYSLSANSPARTHWPLRREGITEDMLVPQMLEDKAYDDAGRLRWERREGEGSTREETIAYGVAGEKSHALITWKNSSGDVYYQTDYLPDGRKRTIRCDPSGRPVGFEGDLPDDLAQGFQWGRSSAGFAFALSVAPILGQQECIRFVLIVRNSSERERQAPLEIWPEVELRDSRGRVVRQTAIAEQQSQRAARLKGRCGESSALLRPAEAYTVRAIDLSELYESLTPGAYSMVVRHCVAAGAPPAMSNPVGFTVE